MKTPLVTPTFFKTAAALRRWLEKNHASATELWVGMYKVGSGKKAVTYREALDEALCFGWIDGVRKSVDNESYVQRFTPRRPKSYWSAVNTKRVEELQRDGRMHPSGMAAFERRDRALTDRYSFERQAATLDGVSEKVFRANKKAWSYFDAEAPWYRRVAIHWVTSAKREETRQRRLARLIEDSAAGRRFGALPQKKNSR